MRPTKKQLLTTGDLARACKTAKHRMKYLLEAYGIEPKQRAGNMRLWSSDQLPAVRAALARIAARKEAACVRA